MQKLAEALVSAQGEIKNASLNKTNPHFKSKYADLAEIRDCTIPILAKHGLAVTQLTDIRDGQVCLITRLLHKSGEHMDSVYPLNADPLKPQAMGSAMTYARRYCLAALCGIAAEEDDDGNAAEKHPRKINDPNAKPKAQSREPYEALQKNISDFTSMDALSDWWNSDKTRADKMALPVDWRKMLFVRFATHALSIAENDAAMSAFKLEYRDAFNGLSSEELQGIDDAVELARAGNSQAAA